MEHAKWAPVRTAEFLAYAEEWHSMSKKLLFVAGCLNREPRMIFTDRRDLNPSQLKSVVAGEVIFFVLEPRQNEELALFIR